VYLPTTGEYGQVSYSGFKVEGSPSIRVSSVGPAGDTFTSNIYGGSCSISISPLVSYASEEGGGIQEAQISMVADNVQRKTRCSSYSNETKQTHHPHFAVNLLLLTEVQGEHSATVTVYHDGNEEGYSTFTIVGTVQ